MTNEIIAQVNAAGSPEEILKVLRDNGVENFTEVKAKLYFDFIHKHGEVSDEEIENAVGGCNTYGHPTVTCDQNCNCGRWEQGFEYDYETRWYNAIRLDNQALREVWHALTVGGPKAHKCGNCRHVGFNSGLGFCEEQ